MLFQPSLPAAPPPVTYILPPAAQEVIYTPLAHNVLFSSKKKRTGLRLVGTKKKNGARKDISLKQEESWSGVAEIAPKHLFLSDWHHKIYWPDFYILKRDPVFCVFKNNTIYYNFIQVYPKSRI